MLEGQVFYLIGNTGGAVQGSEVLLMPIPLTPLELQ